ncbi:family 43 glycosylhydrolase [Mangrovibacterium lignilyticum]|uniref:family 43 glycosylhydrolase n=1 Tax=Mangrovibacterium lignilyticum TaxID=2668052 RepID=UPI001966EF65|nr:family 43 glycosylhydrolase [Mangrovibacterium lignilyticum]
MITMKTKGELRAKLAAMVVFSGLAIGNVSAQNPIIRNQFSADPSARVFNGKVYVFPSHDIPTPSEKPGRKDWFCMEDYHVFSSENLTDWTDHGVIVSQENVPWVDSTSYSMWAPDCIERNGKYYFYFPANTKVVDANGRKGFGIGVAVADKPEGPYLPQSTPIEGVHGIDPNVFIDKDGQAYLYWSMGRIFVAKLKENMLELDSEPMAIANLPEKGLKEGPYLFERNGIYYLTFPHVENTIERLEYATADNPMGPFTMKGVIMDELPMNCWTVHQSVINFQEQWYLFYHQNEYSPKFDKNRSVCMDSLSFNPDGSICKVIPSRRGVGLTSASSQIQPDRYSAKSEDVSIAFLDTANTFAGWKTVLPNEGDWVQYNAVDFGDGKLKALQLRVQSQNKTMLKICLDNLNGKELVRQQIPAKSGWQLIDVSGLPALAGVHNLVICLVGENPVEIDWIQFKP